jgi:hypothetical protein
MALFNVLKTLKSQCVDFILIYPIAFFCIENYQNTPSNTTLECHIILCYVLHFAQTISRHLLLQQFTKHKYSSACNCSLSEISLSVRYLLKLQVYISLTSRYDVNKISSYFPQAKRIPWLK